jgi:hypothetical protein
LIDAASVELTRWQTQWTKGNREQIVADDHGPHAVFWTQRCPFYLPIERYLP